MAPKAATISVAETLALLDSSFADFADGIVRGKYALWLGSGISLGRVDGLGKVIPRVVEFLRSQADLDDPNCRFTKALNAALNLAQLSEVEKDRLDPTKPYAEWEDGNAISARLAANYAKLLDIDVTGEGEDFLLWEAVKVAATYGDPALEPDVEHLCLAVLAIEGVAPEIVSANWDGLIEKAVDILSGSQAVLSVVVLPEELRADQLKARLYKFHGCAVKARESEEKYRASLVARHTQIGGWFAQNPVIAGSLIQLLKTKRTLMMGLSAQDANIQAIFAKAEAELSWPWPAPSGEPPSYVFSEDEIGLDQKAILKNVYRSGYTAETRDTILQSALIQAFAKPLLVALVIEVLRRKVTALLDLVPSTLVDLQPLKEGIVALRDLCASGDAGAIAANIVERGARTISRHRDGSAPKPGIYYPITGTPVQQFPADGALASTGMPEAAVALGLLGLGVQKGDWTLSFSGTGDDELMVVNSTLSSAKLLLVENSFVAARLQHSGFVEEDQELVLVHSKEQVVPMARSPRASIGRKGKGARRDVSIASLMADATTVDDLYGRFRAAAAL